MTRKINVFTFLIFIYSIIICMTCKRDFSDGYSKFDKVNDRFLQVNNILVPVSIDQPVFHSSPIEKIANN